MNDLKIKLLIFENVLAQILEFKIATIHIKRSSERANACYFTQTESLNDNTLILLGIYSQIFSWFKKSHVRNLK